MSSYKHVLRKIPYGLSDRAQTRSRDETSQRDLLELTQKIPFHRNSVDNDNAQYGGCVERIN